VTILQWFTRFDAALGFRLLLALTDYSKDPHRRRQLPKLKDARDLLGNSLGWRPSLAWHL
jgi:hypothetical protein